MLILFTPYDRDIATYKVPSLWFLDVFLIGFIFWINLQFSARDSDFIWIAYFPMALLVVYFFNLFWPRSNLRAKVKLHSLLIFLFYGDNSLLLVLQ